MHGKRIYNRNLSTGGPQNGVSEALEVVNEGPKIIIKYLIKSKAILVYDHHKSILKVRLIEFAPFSHAVYFLEFQQRNKKLLFGNFHIVTKILTITL